VAADASQQYQIHPPIGYVCNSELILVRAQRSLLQKTFFIKKNVHKKQKNFVKLWFFLDKMAKQNN